MEVTFEMFALKTKTRKVAERRRAVERYLISTVRKSGLHFQVLLHERGHFKLGSLITVAVGEITNTITEQQKLIYTLNNQF